MSDASDNHGDLPALLSPTDASPFTPLSDESSEKEAPEPPQGIERQEEDPAPAEEHELESETEEKAPDRPSEYDTYLAACAMTRVNVRSGPTTASDILFTLKAGDSLPYLGKEGEWIMVQTQSGIGYLYGKYAFLAETSAAIESVIRAGLNKIGTPYEWGAPRLLTPSGAVNPYFTGKSFDCSSFVQYCYYVGCGIKLGNYTGSQADYTVGERIHSYSSLRRGDFYFTGTGKISHVVIYLGGGYLLQTYSANGGPVSVTTDERWKAKFISGRRPDLCVVDQFQ